MSGPRSEAAADARARFHRDYRVALLRYVSSRDEAALTAAYELGRASLTAPLRLVDVIDVHHAVLRAVVLDSGADQTASVIEASGALLCEVLAAADLALSTLSAHGPDAAAPRR